MAITIKSHSEIEKMREAGKILADVHDRLGEIIEPGISTLDIDRKGEEMIRKAGCIPSFLNYEGYPASICVSVNDEVVHGIPNKKNILKEGDIVSLDAGVIYEGYHSDAARTWGVGNIDPCARALIEAARDSFFAGMRFARAGYHLYDISGAVEAYAESLGYGVVRELTGHGIGTHLHEPPLVPNTAQKGRGLLLVPNMTIAVEPMINAGSADIQQTADGWTIKAADGSLSAHYENTVLIRDGEPELLTSI